MAATRPPHDDQPGLFDQAALCRARGRRGEELALAWLEERGYRILERNLRRRQAGEVDVLATRLGVLHVIEVKCGRALPAELLERVDERKIRLLLTTLARSGWLDGGQARMACQVDLLLVTLGDRGPELLLVEDVCPPEITWKGGTDA